MQKDCQLVGFRIGEETYGVQIGSVREIVRVPEITTVPNAPEMIEGVINLRGKIIPVMDLRKRFGSTAITIRQEEPNSGGGTGKPAAWADREFRLRGIEDTAVGNRATGRGVCRGRIELRDRSGKAEGAPGHPAGYRPAAAPTGIQKT